MSAELTRDHMRHTIERYYAGCNGADKAEMMACFTADAVHYFPPGTNSAPWQGADRHSPRARKSGLQHRTVRPWCAKWCGHAH